MLPSVWSTQLQIWCCVCGEQKCTGFAEDVMKRWLCAMANTKETSLTFVVPKSMTDVSALMSQIEWNEANSVCNWAVITFNL